MPLVASILGKVDFLNLYLVLSGNVPAGASLADAKKLLCLAAPRTLAKGVASPIIAL